MFYKLMITTLSFLYLGVSLASPITLTMTAKVVSSTGIYAKKIKVGQVLKGIYTYDVDERNGVLRSASPGTIPGHEYSSFYEFLDPIYGMKLKISEGEENFTNTAPAAVVVNNDMKLTPADTGGLIAAGTYDWIELLGSTTIDGPTGMPANGEEWTIAIISKSNWFTDGNLIPDKIPSSFAKALIIGQKFSADEESMGVVFAKVSVLKINPPQ